MPVCSFCSLEPDRKWIENEHAIAFADANPVAKGHTLAIPRQHVASIYELSPDSKRAVWTWPPKPEIGCSGSFTRTASTLA